MAASKSMEALATYLKTLGPDERVLAELYLRERWEPLESFGMAKTVLAVMEEAARRACESFAGKDLTREELLQLVATAELAVQPYVPAELEVSFTPVPSGLLRPVARHKRPRASAAKVGRNDPCSCGSGKKYKRCCGAEAPVESTPVGTSVVDSKAPGVEGYTIVKVQTPVSASNADRMRQVLVYDQARELQRQVPLTETIESLMKGRPKAFFYASVEDSRLKLHGEAPWQDW